MAKTSILDTLDFDAILGLPPGTIRQHLPPAGLHASMNDCGKEPEQPPFEPTENLCSIQHPDGTAILPHIDCSVDKGFFLEEVFQQWTCYRRNYFSASFSYHLSPPSDIDSLRLAVPGSPLIQAFALGIRAVLDDGTERRVKLELHTPKRDAGPKINPPFITLSPTPESEPSAQEASSTQVDNNDLLGDEKTSHTMERLQFALHSKRPAYETYLKLVVELWASTSVVNGSAVPEKDLLPENGWVKVAQRYSPRIVVRGDSPSQYQKRTPFSGLIAPMTVEPKL